MSTRKPSVLQPVRGLIFVVLAYGLMFVMGVLLVVPSWASRRFALGALEAGVADGVGEGQTIIFPQGTRAAPDAKLPYKPGVLRLYQRFGLPLELAATNCGCFWPRFGVWRAPGTAVLKFVGSIPPGQDRKQVIAEVEERIESASDALMDQAKN